MLTLFDNWLLEKALAQSPNDQAGLGNSLLKLFDFRGTTGGTNADSIFNTLIGRVMGWVLAAIALIAFIYLIINGVKYITAGGDAAKATEARNGILNAVIGVVIVLVAFIILRFAAGLGGSVGTGV